MKHDNPKQLRRKIGREIRRVVRHNGDVADRGRRVVELYAEQNVINREIEKRFSAITRKALR